MSRSRTLRRLTMALILCVVGVGLLAAPAGAKVRTKTFLVPVTFMHGKNPLNDANCGTIGVAEFAQDPGAISAHATFRLRTSKDPVVKQSDYEGPLFDDELVYVAPFATPATASAPTTSSS